MAIEVTTNNFKAGDENLDINDITVDSNPDDIEQVFENRRRGVTNDLDDIRLTKQDLSLYSLRDRLNKMPAVAHTGEFKHLDHIPYIDVNNDFTGYVPDENDYKNGTYKGERELQYCRAITGSDETTHEERQIGRMWKLKQDTTHNEFDDDFKSYEELNYGLLHLKDKFKIDNMWAYSHPLVTDKRINDTTDGVNYKGDVDPGYESTFVYFPHHIDEIYGMSNLGQMIIKSYEGEAALAKTGSYKGKDKYGVPDVNSEVIGGRNGLMSRKDKTDFDRINEILNTVPTGAKMQQISYTGEFKHLNFTPVGEGEAYGLYTDPESHAAFCATMTPYLAAPTKDGKSGTHGFMSESDKSIMYNYLNINDTREVMGRNYSAHNYVHVYEPGYFHIPSEGKTNQILGYGQTSGVAKWQNRDWYVGDNKGIKVEFTGAKDGEGKDYYTISPIFDDDIDIKDRNQGRLAGKVAPAYHTHDERYINSFTDGTEVLDGSLEITKDLTVRGKITGNSDLDIRANAHIGGNLEVDGEFILGSDMNVDGQINASGSITTESDLQVDGTITAGERPAGNGDKLYIDGSATIDSSLTANGEITGNNGLTITKNGFDVTGNSIVNGNLTVTGEIEGKNVISNQKLTVEKGGFDVTGDSIIDGNLTVNGDVEADHIISNDTLTVEKGGFDVTGDSTVNGDLTVTDQIIGGNINGNHVLIEDGNITATGDIIANNITAKENINGKNLNITKDANIGGTTTTENLIVNNKITAKDIEASNSIKTNILEAERIIVPGGIDGNASSATKLETPRLINGTSFDGTKDITTEYWGKTRSIYISDADGSNTGAAVSVNGSGNATLKLPGSIKASLSGNATTATTLQNTRTINGTNFNGSANITTANWGTPRNIYIQDNSGNHTGPAVSVNGGGNATLKLPANAVFSSITGALSGNATTATTLQTPRTLTIGNTGKSFNGSSNVSWSLSEIGAAATKHTHTADELELPKVDITKVYINGVARTAKTNGNTLIFE